MFTPVRSTIANHPVRFGRYDLPDSTDPLTHQLHLALHGHADEAFSLNNELNARFPNDNRIAFNRGWFLLAQGKFSEGFDFINRGRFENVFGSPPLKTPASLWRGEPLKGKTILLRGEGGLGDQIINVRFARQLSERGAKVIVSADAGLLPVFQRVPGVDGVVLSGQEMSVFHHFWAPAMSAPALVHSTYAELDDSPYLSADPVAIEKWAELLGVASLTSASVLMPGFEPAVQAKRSRAIFNIGVRWSGNPQFEHEQFRKIPKEQMWESLKLVRDRLAEDHDRWSQSSDRANHAEPAQLRFFSLEQKTDAQAPSWITQLGNSLTTWEDTLGAMSHMDLIVSACTSVAHASSALGRPTAVLVPVLPYYIWATPGEYTPWYRGTRLFRQTKFGDWAAALAELSEVLIERVGIEKI
jgi:hypothetical protein